MKKSIVIAILLSAVISASISAKDKAAKSIMTKKYDPATNLVSWPEKLNPQVAKWYVYNEIEINASPEVVWDILIRAKQWHTYYKGVQSPVEFLDTAASVLRAGLTFKLHTMGIHLVPEIREFVPNERMAWMVNRRNLIAYHAWVIVPTEKGCRLITPESQNGFLTYLQRIFQPNKLLKLHDTWLKSIREKAENQKN